MTHGELLAKIEAKLEQCTCDGWNNNCFDDDNVPWLMLRGVVELHKPYDSQDTPHELAMGWCKGCSIEYSIKEYASQPYPCPTIRAIEKELG